MDPRNSYKRTGYIIVLITLFCVIPIVLTAYDNLPNLNVSPDTLLMQKVNELESMLRARQYDPQTDLLYSEITEILTNESIADSVGMATACYYLAVYNQNRPIPDINTAIMFFEKARRIWLQNGVYDETYSKACINLGILYLTSDPILSVAHSEEGLRVRQKIFGVKSYQNISPLVNLSSSYVQANYYDEAIQSAVQGINILDEYGDLNPTNSVKLHYNAGVGYLCLEDYSTSQNYLQVAHNIYNQNKLGNLDLLLRIFNGLAVSYGNLGEKDKSEEYFEKAMTIIESSKTSTTTLSNTIISNFAYQLVKTEELDRAETLLKHASDLALSAYGEEGQDYLIELENYAYFLSNYRGRNREALELYNKFDNYIDKNQTDRQFINSVYSGYAKALGHDQRNAEALKMLDIVLSDTVYLSDRSRLSLLVNRREQLIELYKISGNTDYLIDAFESIVEATDIYDRIRIELASEQSQLKVAERFNYVYEDCIGTLNMLYISTGDEYYKELIFNYSEKAKASSLLATTRASRAIRFHIPEDVARLERSLEKERMAISELIYNERISGSPDLELITRYEAAKLKIIMKDDSLKNVFEKDYPRYNSLKSNTTAAGYQDVRKSIGKNVNFVEYFVSDTMLYIYVVNRKNFEMRVVPYSAELQKDIRDFREIMINPAIDSGARQQYCDYTRIGYSLYESLIQSVEEHFISDRLIIAPDHLLSYIPFEALLSESVNDSSMNYRTLPFIVDSYDVLYAYSGTLLTETSGASRSFRNPALIFAPEYSGEIYVDSILVTRQLAGKMLDKIPGAREEAICINEKLGGDLFLDSEATESRFKERAPYGKVIHLAMHTLLNDTDPMYSKMVFSLDDDGPNDGKLNTYEVYDIPLSAKMVVLSSCNTGSGYLQSGEGVMSLARGFFYSGSPTVIMSLWEVDDRSGSKIMSKFYGNLHKGFSKSKSLRKARLDYLSDADQMRSHPYFWCTTVIMGDDGPIFRSRTRISIVLLLLAFTLVGILYRQRIRSS